MPLEFYKLQKLWRSLDSFPSHDFKIDASYENAFNRETNIFSSKLPKGEIPNQLVIDDTLPTRDACITFTDDPKKIQYRIFMFGSNHNTTTPITFYDDETIWVGGVCCDYGVVRPMIRFGVNSKKDYLIIEDEIQWLAFKNLRGIVEWEKVIDGPYKLSKKLVKRILKIWYGIELHMLYHRVNEMNNRESKYERYMTYIKKSKIDLPEDVVIGYPSKRLYNKTPGAKGADGYYVNKSNWFKQGYNTTSRKNGKVERIIFVQPCINIRTPQSEAEEEGQRKLAEMRAKKNRG